MMLANKLFELQDAARDAKRAADDFQSNLLEGYKKAFVELTGREFPTSNIRIYRYSPMWQGFKSRDVTGLSDIIEVWFYDDEDENGYRTRNDVAYVVGDHFDTGKFDLEDCTTDKMRAKLLNSC
jgi:hypothetical protein